MKIFKKSGSLRIVIQLIPLSFSQMIVKSIEYLSIVNITLLIMVLYGDILNIWRYIVQNRIRLGELQVKVHIDFSNLEQFSYSPGQKSWINSISFSLFGNKLFQWISNWYLSVCLKSCSVNYQTHLDKALSFTFQWSIKYRRSVYQT